MLTEPYDVQVQNSYTNKKRQLNKTESQTRKPHNTGKQVIYMDDIRFLLNQTDSWKSSFSVDCPYHGGWVSYHSFSTNECSPFIICNIHSFCKILFPLMFTSSSYYFPMIKIFSMFNYSFIKCIKFLNKHATNQIKSLLL